MIEPLRGGHPDRNPGGGRLPALRPGLLSDEQRDVYEAVTGGPRGARPAPFPVADAEGRLNGPFNAMLYSPHVGMPLQELGAALRFRTGFTRREREIAVLVVAQHWRSDFEWFAHERLGRRAGLTEDELTALREGRAPLLADVRERVVHEAARQLAADGDLGDAVYTEAIAALGRAVLVELVTLVGYYAGLALQLRVFRTGVPAGETAPTWTERDDE
ncbi:carboxymuconolactone decarboxylase family protein [Actinomadura atramentaria]|uniref:carboxymuconolactone decarboxylase family protein n=1 Tax=Actinomadura atramentaria TaxID=1990 RepID=UPI000382630D|nr:carboxymuconolactone decarboxylase family protein [Actinomadura atramentaria]